MASAHTGFLNSLLGQELEISVTAPRGWQSIATGTMVSDRVESSSHVSIFRGAEFWGSPNEFALIVV